MSMFRSWSSVQHSIIKSCFEVRLPSVEFIRIEYLPWNDRFTMLLFMRPGEWYLECYLDKQDINNPCLDEILTPIVKELKNYLNPVWC